MSSASETHVAPSDERDAPHRGPGEEQPFQVVDRRNEGSASSPPPEREPPSSHGPPGGGEGGHEGWAIGLVSVVLAGLVAASWVTGLGPIEGVAPGGLAPVTGSANESEANWTSLEVTLEGNTGEGPRSFRTQVIGYDASGEAIPGSQIADRGEIHHLATDEAIEPPARNRSGWSACDPTDCKFTAAEARYVYVGWDRDGRDGGLPSNAVRIDLEHRMKAVWVAPGEWDFEEPWTGSHTFSVSKAQPVETLDLQDLSFEVHNATVVEDPCESVITSEPRCFELTINVTSEAETSAPPPSLNWGVAYEQENGTRWLPFVDGPRQELSPHETQTVAVDVPLGDERDPSRLTVEESRGDGPPRVELDLSRWWGQAGS